VTIYYWACLTSHHVHAFSIPTSTGRPSLFLTGAASPSCLSATVATANGGGNETSVSTPEPASSKPKKKRFRPTNNNNNDNNPTTPRNFKDAYVLNEAINKLAEQAGDYRQPVIRRAAAAEDLWKEFTVANDDPQVGDSEVVMADIVSFNTVLKAWSKAAQILADNHSDRNREHLLDPNIPVYTAKECAQHSLELLNEQSNLLGGDDAADLDEDSTMAPLDVNSFNTCMDAWAKSKSEGSIEAVEDLLRRLQKSKTLEPDLRSYNALVDAYANAGSDDRLEKLDRIWQHMEESPNLQPSSRTMNSILHAYSLKMKDNPRNKAELAAQAYSKFQKLKKRYEDTGLPDYFPDAITYTTVMDVFSRVGSLEATRTVESLFRQLQDGLEDGGVSGRPNLKPTAYSYTVLITAWSRVAWADEAPQRVSDLLEEMMQDKDIQMSGRPFTAALLVYSRSKIEGKAVQALNTLKQMKEIASQGQPLVLPNIQTYHAALDCCAKTTDTDLRQHTVALKISFAILQSMTKDGIDATNVTYTKLLKCVETLLPAGGERNQVAVAAFEKARTAGVADPMVLKAFQKAADSQKVSQIVGDIADRNGYMDFSRIPAAWTKNVR